MKPNPWIAWLYGIGLAGACLIAAGGCGGGDVPDASDSAALTEGDGGSAEPAMPAPPAPVAAAPAPAAPVAAAPAPAAPGDPAAAPGAAPAAPAEAASPFEPVADAKPAPAGEAASPFEPVADAEPAASGAAKPENGSATAELLAIATAPAEPAAKAEGPQGGQGAQGDPAMMAANPDTGMLGPQGAADPNAGQEAMQRQMQENFGAAAAGDTGMLAGSGTMDSGGSGGNGKEEGDTTSPDGAVKAFLSALKSKDRDRLAEATALRAASAAEGGKHRDVFARILDSSISDTELDEIASQMEDFKVSGFNQPKSTGQLKVTTRKTGKNGGWLQRTFTVRREKKGWGVLDIDAQVEFHGRGRFRTMQRGGQNNSNSGSSSGSSSNR